MTIYLVFLCWDIMFDDADNGSCYAGEGNKLLKAFSGHMAAQRFVDQFDLENADEGMNTENFKLVITPVEVEEVST